MPDLTRGNARVLQTFALGALAFAVGCKDARSKCRQSADELAACRAACDEGVPGEDGCLALAARTSKLGSKPEAVRAAVRACDLGRLEECRVALTFVYDSDGYLPVLSRGCSLGEKEYCEIGVEKLLPETPREALPLWKQLCQLNGGTAATACEGRANSTVDAAVAAKPRCTQSKPGACYDLAVALGAYDIQLTARALAAECKLRGRSGPRWWDDVIDSGAHTVFWPRRPLSPLTQEFSAGMGQNGKELSYEWCVQRMAGKIERGRAENRAIAPASGTLGIGKPKLEGSDDESGITATLERGRPAIARCFDQPAKLSLVFDVDSFGGALTPDVQGGLDDLRKACVIDAVADLTFPRPSAGKAQVSVSLDFVRSAPLPPN